MWRGALPVFPMRGADIFADKLTVFDNIYAQQGVFQAKLGHHGRQLGALGIGQDRSSPHPQGGANKLSPMHPRPGKSGKQCA